MKNQKMINNVVGGLLGLLFIIFGSNFFLKFISIPPAPEGSPAAAFFGSLFTTGYLAFIKVLEIVGGIAVAIPRLRRLGLLILGPIVVNILAFQIYFTKGAGLTQPPVILATVFTLFLVWAERRAFFNFLKS